MATKKKTDVIDAIADEMDRSQTYNPLLNALRENDKKNLFATNVTTAFHKTGFHLFDYYFGSVINIHNELGEIVRQEPRVGQAAGTFNLFIGNTGSGKAQPLTTKIPLPGGKWKFMGDIKVGDQVLDGDGNPTTVIGVFPQGEKPVYEIRWNDGFRNSVCCIDHLWDVRKEGETDYTTMSLKEICEEMRNGEYNGRYYIPPSPIGDFLEEPYIDDIIHIGSQECQCIAVDNPLHRYLTQFYIVTHNTTLASQIAANIIRQYRYSNVIHYDCENRFDVSRCETITQLPASFFDGSMGPERYMIKTGLVGLDVIQEMIVKTYVSKMKLKKDLIVPSGFKNEFGKDVMIFEPTVIVIDSMTSVVNETFNPENSKDASDAEKMRGNTEGARDAKSLKGFFKDVLPLCKEANIIIFGINHINNNMSMNSFIPVAKQQNFLKQDESIPGGKTMLYYPFNIVKLIAKPSDDFTEDSDGFAGHMVMVEPIKSSSNQSGNNSKGVSFEMVFSFKYGFDALRTIIMYGKDIGVIEGNKTRMKFKEDDSFTFSLKNIVKEKDEKPIWENIKKYIFPHLNTHLSFIEPSDVKFDNRSMDY